MSANETEYNLLEELHHVEDIRTAYLAMSSYVTDWREETNYSRVNKTSVQDYVRVSGQDSTFIPAALILGFHSMQWRWNLQRTIQCDIFFYIATFAASNIYIV